MKLTQSRIKKLVYDPNGPSSQIHFDDEHPGFGVRVYPNGSKSFILDYRLKGRQRRMVIGRFGIWSLDEARKQARRYAVEIDKGVDPLEQKQTEQGAPLFSSVCLDYIEEYAKSHKRSWKEDQRRINKHIKPKLGKRRIDAIRRADVMNLHGSLGKDHKYEANRVLALVSVIFEYARKQGHIDEAAVNPARGIDKFKEQKRDRWIKPEEMPKLIEAIGKCSNVYVRSALMLYLLTGLRKNELLRAKWEDVDLSRGEIRLPETKAGRVHILPLSDAAIAILRTIPKQEDNPYVFPGRRNGGHLIGIQKFWEDIREKAGMADVRLHDLRRTVGSWMATGGQSIQVIGKVLNHADLATTQKVYAHLSEDPVRQAMKEHGEKIISMSDIKQTQKEKTA